MSYVPSNIPLTTGDTVDVTFHLNSATSVSNTETVIVFPAGTSYQLLSAVTSAGTFDETDTWNVDITAGVEETLTITVVIDDVDAFEGGTKDVVGTTTAALGEVIVLNNVAHNVIETLNCTEVSVCGDGVFVHIGIPDEEVEGKVFIGEVTVPYSVYDSVTWCDSNNTVPTKQAICEIIESLVLSIVPDADYGDITVSGGVWTIDNDVVTFAKMQNISTDKLLGRDTAGSGDTEEISVGGGIEFTGAGAIQRSALAGGDVTAPAGSAVTTIANDAVTFAKLQDIATDSLIGRDTAGSGNPESITLNATLEFTGSQTIQRAAIGGDVVISAGSNSALIPNDTITYAKMQNVSATDKILGRISGGSGDVEEITFTDQAQQLADDVSFSAMRTTLGLAIGTDVEAHDPTLTALAAFNTNGLLTQTAADTFTGRTLTGTANEITVSQGDGVAGNPTVSLPTTIDLGGKTSLEIPNSAAPTVDADGEIALDTTVADFSAGVINYFSTEVMGVVAMPIAEFTSPVNGAVPTYSSADDEFQMVVNVAPLIYEAVLSQTGSGAPTATVLYNTLGETPTFTHVGVGDYTVDIVATLFDAAKTSVLVTLGGSATTPVVRANVKTTTKLEIFTSDITDVAAELEGDLTISVKIWP